MRRLCTVTLFSVFLLNACVDPWEDRFNKEFQTTQTVWELLETNQEYSDFVALLKETELDSILRRSASFSVYIPERTSLESLSGLTTGQKKSILNFHLSNSIVYSSDVIESLSVKTLNGKQIFLERRDGEIILNQTTRLLKGDIRATNGALHEIEQLLELRSNIYEIIQNNVEFSSTADFISEGSEVFFDEENSLPVGLDSIGQTIYDSVWVTTNDFFSQYADLNSEDESYTVFLAEDSLLDSFQNGELKGGYLATLPRFITHGIYTEDDLPQELISVNGQKLFLPGEMYDFYKSASNGLVYKLNSLANIGVPLSVTWEFTDASDFDTIRGIKSTNYLDRIEALEEISVTEIDGDFTEFAYEIKNGALNRDYLKIGTTGGTSATIVFDLPQIIPGKYRLTINAIIRAADGIRYDAYLNGNLISAGNSLNGGTYQFELREIGTVEIMEAEDNVFSMVIDGSNSQLTKCYIDYLLFEPVK